MTEDYDAYFLGYMAFEDGDSMADNPFDEGSVESDEWLSGFESADWDSYDFCDSVWEHEEEDEEDEDLEEGEAPSEYGLGLNK